MTTRDLKSNLSVISSLPPNSQNSTVNGAGVDLIGFDSALAVIDIGAVSGTNPSFTFEVQESDDNAAFSAVADSDLQGAEPVVTTGSAVHRVGYVGQKRYLRVAITAVSGTSPVALCSAGILRGHPHHSPV